MLLGCYNHYRKKKGKVNRQDQFGPGSDGKGITISLQVANIQQTRAESREAGITPTLFQDVWGAKAIYVYDPEGNRLEFWSGMAKVKPRPDVIFEETRK